MSKKAYWRLLNEMGYRCPWNIVAPDRHALDFAGLWNLPGRRDGVSGQMGLCRDCRGPGRDWNTHTNQQVEEINTIIKQIAYPNSHRNWKISCYPFSRIRVVVNTIISHPGGWYGRILPGSRIRPACRRHSGMPRHTIYLLPLFSIA